MLHSADRGHCQVPLWLNPRLPPFLDTPCCTSTLPQVLETKGRNNLPTALEVLTEVTVKYPWFTPALLEKARLLLAVNDWEQMGEIVQGLVRKVRGKGLSGCGECVVEMVLRRMWG